MRGTTDNSDPDMNRPYKTPEVDSNLYKKQNGSYAYSWVHRRTEREIQIYTDFI